MVQDFLNSSTTKFIPDIFNPLVLLTFGLCSNKGKQPELPTEGGGSLSFSKVSNESHIDRRQGQSIVEFACLPAHTFE